MAPNESNTRGPALTYDGIIDLLPHRPPLLLVDRVLTFDVEDVAAMAIEATKCVSSLDPVFAGHFPGNPVFPGVYIVEGLAQASALMCFTYFRRKGMAFEAKCLLTSIDEARFRKPVVPGDVLHYHVKYERSRGHFAWFHGVAKVDGEVVAEAKFSALLPTALKP
jgi:3-hydroxyacyl-[acyl-carrier-protein] dehydratase